MYLIKWSVSLFLRTDPPTAKKEEKNGKLAIAAQLCATDLLSRFLERKLKLSETAHY